MGNLQVFNNSEFGTVRTIEINSKPYFSGSDVAKALGYAIPSKAINTHCKGVSKMEVPTKGGKQEMLFISEGDVYRLIAKSKLPSAEKFEHWVFDEVLPSIRKNGGYIANQENLSDDELLERALIVAQRKIEERNKEIAQQKEQIAIMQPKAIFADAVSSSSNSILIRDMAKLLKQNGVDIGEKRLFEYLRNNGYLIKRPGADYNSPTQRAMELGLFEIKETVVAHTNDTRVHKTSKITGKGQRYFINKFLSNK